MWDVVMPHLPFPIRIQIPWMRNPVMRHLVMEPNKRLKRTRDQKDAGS